MSLNQRLVALESQIQGLKAAQLATSKPDGLYAYLGAFVAYGCKVTEGSDDTDMILSLEGQASGDSAYLNPDVSATPTRSFQYPNIAGCKGGFFFSNDTVATVTTAPSAGSARYDIAYIFAGKEGAGFAIAAGTPSAGVLADFGSNGLQTGAYGLESPDYDPVLPVGAVPVARIYVAPSVTAITDSVIADLRAFAAPSMTFTAQTYSELALLYSTQAAASTAAAAEIVNIDDVQVFTNNKVFSQAIKTTAASSGSNGIQVQDSAQIDVGESSFTIDIDIALPDWTPSARQRLYYHYADADNYLELSIDTSGLIAFEARIGATTHHSSSTVKSSAATGVTDGRTAKLTMVLQKQTASLDGSVTFYLNGVILGTAVTISSATPVDFSVSGNLYIAGSGSDRIESVIRSAALFNRALSAAEVLALAIGGIDYTDRWASQTAAYTSDFTTDEDGWIAGNGSVAGNVDSIGGEDNWLRFTLNTSDAVHQMNKNIGYAENKKNRLTFKYYIPSGQTVVNSISVLINSANTLLISHETLNVTDTVTEVSFEFLGVGSTPNVYFYSNNAGAHEDPGGDDVFYIKDVECKHIGALLALEPEGIQLEPGQWIESSDNFLHGMQPATGSAAERHMKNFELRHTNTWAGTHESQYIGGVNQNVLPENAFIESIVGIVSGSTIEDIAVGDGSDADRFVVATTGLAAGTVVFSIANNTHDGTNRKMTVDPDANFTGSIAWTIKGYILES